MKVHGCIVLLLSAAALTFMLLLKDWAAQSEMRRLALAVVQHQADAQRRQAEAVRFAERSRDPQVLVASKTEPPPSENPSSLVAPPTPKTREELFAEIKAKIQAAQEKGIDPNKVITSDEASLYMAESSRRPTIITTGSTMEIGGRAEKLNSVSTPQEAVRVTSRGEGGVNVVYGTNPDATPQPPHPRSFEALSEAIARGEDVVLKIKYDSAEYPYHYLHDGVVKVSKTAVTFQRTIGTDDFTVSPDKIIELVNQPEEASRILLKVTVKNARRSFGHDFAGKKEFYFYNTSAVTAGQGPGGTGLSIECKGCDDSMSVLYALLQKVSGK